MSPSIMRPRAWMYMPHGEDTAAIIVFDCGGLSVTETLPPSQARVVEFLALAKNADAASGLPNAVQGWRSLDQIAQTLGASSKAAYPLEGGSVRRYVGRINAAVAAALVGQSRDTSTEFSPIITLRRGLGIRIAYPIEIVRPNR